MKSKNSKLARLACILCSAVAITAIFAAPVFPAWPAIFNHGQLPSAGGPVLSYGSHAVVSATVTPVQAAQADSELPWEAPAKPVAAAAVPLRERCILPWNCPNRCPREEVNVSVQVPKTDTTLTACVEPPAEPPFPYGLLLAVLIPVVILASAAAFAIRVATSRG